jgi:arylsulfatase A
MHQLFQIAVIVLFLNACKAPQKAQVNSNLQSSNKYNIVLIVADDLGRQDVAPFGNTIIETPQLAKMASEGLTLNNGYAAAPLCSPTRASIITGNNPTRINLTEHLHGYAPAGPNQKLITPKIETGLPPNLITIPEALKAANYKSAHIGKWHLGMGPSSPAQQGFQLVYGGGAEGLPNSFFFPFFNGKPYPSLITDSKEGDFLDDVLTNRAIKFLQNNKDSNFFLELNFYAPHVPIQGKADLVNKYAKKRLLGNYQPLPNNEYAAMVESIDANVGRVIQTIKNLQLDKNTIVIFTSDNGGLSVQEVPAFAKHTPPTVATPFKDGKGYISQGGIKTPWLIWAPSFVKANSISDVMVSTDDIFNTCMEAAGLTNTSPDGSSIMPLLKGAPFNNRDYFLHFPHYSPQHGKPGALVISGNYKLIEWYETGRVELFDLTADPSEQTDISSNNNTITNSLLAKLNAWRKNMDAKMCSPNPNYTATK